MCRMNAGVILDVILKELELIPVEHCCPLTLDLSANRSHKMSARSRSKYVFN